MKRGRYRLLSDRQADIIRAISRHTGARVIATELQLDHRTVRAIRNRQGAYAYTWPEVDDNLGVEDELLRRFPNAVALVDGG